MKPALKTAAIALLLALLFAVAFAPATLIRTFLPEDGGITVQRLQGSLWNGSGDLAIGAMDAGRVQWRFRPAALLRARLGYALTLEGPEHRLDGQVGFGPSDCALVVNGQMAHRFVNRWLAPYDIDISGDLTLTDIEAQVPYDLADAGAGRSAGTVTWNGGPIGYTLARRKYSGQLPPLVAYLGQGLEAVVYPRDRETPLLQLQILPRGFVRVGVTRLLTELAGNPWPGSHADHDVVLEVEEQLF